VGVVALRYLSFSWSCCAMVVALAPCCFGPLEIHHHCPLPRPYIEQLEAAQSVPSMGFPLPEYYFRRSSISSTRGPLSGAAGPDRFFLEFFLSGRVVLPVQFWFARRPPPEHHSVRNPDNKLSPPKVGFGQNRAKFCGNPRQAWPRPPVDSFMDRLIGRHRGIFAQAMPGGRCFPDTTHQRFRFHEKICFGKKLADSASSTPGPLPRVRTQRRAAPGAPPKCWSSTEPVFECGVFHRRFQNAHAGVAAVRKSKRIA